MADIIDFQARLRARGPGESDLRARARGLTSFLDGLVRAKAGHDSRLFGYCTEPPQGRGAPLLIRLWLGRRQQLLGQVAVYGDHFTWSCTGREGDAEIPWFEDVDTLRNRVADDLTGTLINRMEVG